MICNEIQHHFAGLPVALQKPIFTMNTRCDLLMPIQRVAGRFERFTNVRRLGFSVFTNRLGIS